MGDHVHFLFHVLLIARHAPGLVFRNQAALQPLIVRGDTGRAGVLVAAERLDTAEREHESPGRGHEIRTGTQRQRNVGRRREFAAGDQPDPFFQSMPGQQVGNQRQALADRQADVVDQGHGCSTCTAIARIDGNEVRRALDAATADFLKQFVEPVGRTDDRLETDRLAADLAHPVYEIEQLAVAADLDMAVRTQ